MCVSRTYISTEASKLGLVLVLHSIRSGFSDFWSLLSRPLSLRLKFFHCRTYLSTHRSKETKSDLVVAVSVWYCKKNVANMTLNLLKNN